MFRRIDSKEVSRRIEELNDDFIEVSCNFWNFSFVEAHLADFGGPFSSENLFTNFLPYLTSFFCWGALRKVSREINHLKLLSSIFRISCSFMVLKKIFRAFPLLLSVPLTLPKPVRSYVFGA